MAFNMITLRIGPFGNFDKKILFFDFRCVEPGRPHNGAGTKISSNFDFNMLTLRIRPFGNFEKKNFFSKNAKFCKILKKFAKLPIFGPNFLPEDDK